MANIKVYEVNFDYKEFYEIGQKKIKELEQQIEKMKCCGNCRNLATRYCADDVCAECFNSKDNYTKWEFLGEDEE